MFAAAALLALAGSAVAVPLIGNFTIEKRAYTNARFTWYDVDVGYGACGATERRGHFPTPERCQIRANKLVDRSRDHESTKRVATRRWLTRSNINRGPVRH